MASSRIYLFVTQIYLVVKQCRTFSVDIHLPWGINLPKKPIVMQANGSDCTTAEAERYGMERRSVARMLCGQAATLILHENNPKIETTTKSGNAYGETVKNNWFLWSVIYSLLVCPPSAKFHLHVVSLAPGLSSTHRYIYIYRSNK